MVLPSSSDLPFLLFDRGVVSTALHLVVRWLALGAQGGIRTRRALDCSVECRTGDSRAYSRPAPASRGPGYTTLTRPILTDGARARILISWAITLPESLQA